MSFWVRSSNQGTGYDAAMGSTGAGVSTEAGAVDDGIVEEEAAEVDGTRRDVCLVGGARRTSFVALDCGFFTETRRSEGTLDL